MTKMIKIKREAKEKLRRTTIELTIRGDDVACFVKPHIHFVCDTIVRGMYQNVIMG
jgi:hypothetical protein